MNYKKPGFSVTVSLGRWAGFRRDRLRFVMGWVAVTLFPFDADVAMSAILRQGEKCESLLTEYVNCPHEFDDERMKYVAVQVDKGLLKEAKSLLGI